MGKYNYGSPVNIDNMPDEEKYAAMKEFAEGSPILEECLITANKLGFETTNCCRGYHEIENTNKFLSDYLFNKNLDYIALARCFCPAYISFKKNSKVLNNLSSELINNPNICISTDYDPAIYFYGSDCSQLMEMFLKDIKSGAKQNEDALVAKVEQPLSADCYYESYEYGLKKSGFTKENMECLKMIMGLNACKRARLSTQEDIHDFCKR